jgi:CRISPR-associated protein Cmr1
LRVEIVTPIYGGGVEAGVPDEAMAVRAAAIRGQLRFWWRLLAAQGGRRLVGRALFEAERAIWGGLGKEPTASQVRVGVRVEGETPGAVTCRALLDRYHQNRQGSLAYALFAGLEGDNQERAMLLPPPLTFALSVSAPEGERATVENALRWWASFGGVGGRTRRGLGTVRVMREDATRLPPVTAAEAAACGCPLVQRGSQQNAVQAWSEAVARLRAFRQGTEEGEGRNKGSQANHPGRSRWPEADSIREIAGAGRTVDHPVRKAFPRAAFGMPIIFHFQKNAHEPHPPRDHTLQPRGSERLASPLIVKAQAVADGFAPVALLLPHDHVNGLGLELKGSAKAEAAANDLQSGQWWRPERAAQVVPLKGRGADALTVFMAFFREGG